MKKFIKMLLAVVAVAFSVNTVFGMDREIKSSRDSAVLAESSVSGVTLDQIFVYFPNPSFLEVASAAEVGFKLLSQDMYMTPHILYPDGTMPECVNHNKDFIVLYPEFGIYNSWCDAFRAKRSSELKAIAEGDQEVINQIMQQQRLVPLQDVNSAGGYCNYASSVLGVLGKLRITACEIPKLGEI